MKVLQGEGAAALQLEQATFRSQHCQGATAPGTTKVNITLVRWTSMWGRELHLTAPLLPFLAENESGFQRNLFGFLR